MTDTILYATLILPARKAGERLARRHQSAAAQRLLEVLGDGFAAHTKTVSHSRHAIAAAVGDAVGLSLGIDIEWMCPDRPFAAIAGLLLDPPPAQIGAAEFYRGWTFSEAWFKAFQRLPPERDLRAIVTRPACNDVQDLPDGAQFLQLVIAGEFQLSLVWRAPTLQTCLRRDVSDELARIQRAAAAGC
ncbi:MAG TPA: hypothetical protein VNX86_05075 [Rhizomicrobium sp.]|jgi:hypothetical protein|nr:hypothetical protein [Rhizomicrobium sp.]